MSVSDFSGKKVLVIGGSSGIGNGIARAFLDAGADVHVWGTRPSATDYSDTEGSDLSGIGYDCVDVSSSENIAQTPDPFETLDILVLSQGTVLYGRKEFEPEGWNKVVSINLDSLMYCAQHFYGKLIESGGNIVVVSSIAAYRATVGNPAYAASKAGAVSLVGALGKAWAPKGIRVNGFAPSLVDTKLTKVTLDHPERREQALQKIPMGRFGTIEDMAGVALFLASPMAGYMTGQTLVVDGGLTL